MCAEDQETTSAAPCEMGAVAEDEEDGNLTYAVLVLPVGVVPADCLEQDCTPYRLMAKGLQVGYLCHPNLLGTLRLVLSFLRTFRLRSYVPACLLCDTTSTCGGFWFWQGCGIDPDAEPGTFLDLRFAVVNHRGGIASVNRTIVITKPCPHGETLCSDKQCSEDCDLRQCPFPKPVVFCLHLP